MLHKHLSVDIFEEVKVPRVYELLIKLLSRQRLKDEKFYKYGYINTRIPHHMNTIRMMNSDTDEEDPIPLEEDPRLCFPAAYSDGGIYPIEVGNMGIPGPGPLRRSGKVYMTGTYHSIAIPEKIDYKDMSELYEEEPNTLKLIEYEKHLRNFLENIYTLNEVNELMEIEDFMSYEYMDMEESFDFLMNKSIEQTIEGYSFGYMEEFDYLSQIVLRKIMFSFNEEVRKVKYQSYITNEDIEAASIIETNPLKVIWLKKVHIHLKQLRRQMYKNYEMIECVICRSKFTLPNQIYRHGISLRHKRQSSEFMDIFAGLKVTNVIYRSILKFLGKHIININFNFYCFE